MTDGIATWNYAYDANGMRTSRTNGTTIYSYVYNGSQLMQMKVGNDTLQFIYNAMGEPVAMLWNGTLYYIVTTLQGDVNLILNTDNEIVVWYEYDAWGNIVQTGGTLADTLGALNPLRYRGYVYDTETGLYYLQSRYYNPEWGRFINADAYISTSGLLGNNMFSYCKNNPVIYHDDTGYYTDGQIHDFVIEHIVATAASNGRDLKYKRWDTLIIYDHIWRGRLFGFCDLYDPITGEVWELKKNSSSYTCSTRYATDQLNNYISNGYLAANPDLKRSLPTSIIPGGKFSKYDSMNNRYVISYWYEGNGILRYSYHIKPSQKTCLAVATVAAGAICGMMFLASNREEFSVMLQ